MLHNSQCCTWRFFISGHARDGPFPFARVEVHYITLIRGGCEELDCSRGARARAEDACMGCCAAIVTQLDLQLGASHRSVPQDCAVSVSDWRLIRRVPDVLGVEPDDVAQGAGLIRDLRFVASLGKYDGPGT